MTDSIASSKSSISELSFFSWLPLPIEKVSALCISRFRSLSAESGIPLGGSAIVKSPFWEFGAPPGVGFSGVFEALFGNEKEKACDEEISTAYRNWVGSQFPK